MQSGTMQSMRFPAFIPLPSCIRECADFRSWQWDIFCTVIDNYGDAGVCWRLAAGLAERGQRVRLWIDQPECLHWMAPQGAAGVDIRRWQAPLNAQELPDRAGDVLIEAFGCTLEDSVQAWWAASHASSAPERTGLWLNLEYLSAEAYVARCHGLPSPVMQGPAAGLVKQFFYPGFTADTGGLLREMALPQRQQRFPASRFLDALNGESATPVAHDPAAATKPGAEAEPLVVSLFCYEPQPLPALLAQLAERPSTLLVFQGRGHQELLRILGTSTLPEHHGQCRLAPLPWLDQSGFDEVLWSSHVNCVRGEDSLVRALWAGQPFVWHIYPQDDDAHHAKLEAFLDWLQAPDDLREFHRIWNGITEGPLPVLVPARLRDWQSCVQAARTRLMEQDDLVSQVLSLAGKAHAMPLTGTASP